MNKTAKDVMEHSDYTIHSLYVYPLKSAKGIQVKHAEASPKGFKHDREWMVVDPKGKFMSQRLHPRMSGLKTAFIKDGIALSAEQMEDIIIPFKAEGESTEAVIWDDTCQVQEVSRELSDWISQFMGEACKIVHMKQGEVRLVDPRYKITDHDNTLFSDGFPYLFTATASLHDLSQRTKMDLEMIRFRPNIVIESKLPFEEDCWKKAEIGNILFHLVKPCGRCSIVNVDPKTGKRGDEPLKTLASFRKQEKKILFGINAITTGSGVISIGDHVTIS